MKKSAALLCVLMVAACAPQRLAWDSDGISPKQFKKDRYACMKEASTAAPPSAGEVYTGTMLVPIDVNARNRNQLFIECMEAKGYELVPVKTN